MQSKPRPDCPPIEKPFCLGRPRSRDVISDRVASSWVTTSILLRTGPKLIEINTNAGGAFLNALLAKAQRACCTEVEVALSRSEADDFEAAVLRMFQREWVLQRGAGTPRRIAIVDDRPEEQYLYPEFVLAQRFFLKHGIETVIADAGTASLRARPATGRERTDRSRVQPAG